ncbi:MAG: hypothetical protein HON98_10245 [Chloroflexi bacterium]|jgi:hypothetical protein|nr:hypothetical protein [Chloroflexota bacterium]MBT3670923.1 hypothetical protein [Chloroflexota bacterium]MBT4002752.1 hypothetical protein [Chloroflexota bacterium]MBT4306363.1 hypothetical protein [Chloroflexota bacterium]MBT4532756.1 hypothetical protein [Chloroflexota bacterium]
MDSERFRIIPRKKGQLLYPLLMAFMYISAFALIIFSEKINIVYFLVYILATSLGFTYLEFHQWKSGWKKLEEASGLALEDNSLLGIMKTQKLTGKYRGYPIEMDGYSVGLGRYRKHYTKVEIELPETLKGSFSLTKRGFWQKNLETTGIEEFDQRFNFSSDMDWVADRLFRNREIEDGMYDLHAQCRTLQLSATDKQLFFQERGRIKDSEYLMALLDFLIKMTGMIKQNN